jgi:bifunctional non-homologous end joining protein LigD
MGLVEYRKKRNFSLTPEPPPVEGKTGGNSFVVQKHAASHLHYDFRLEHDGVLKSWSVPKGPCFDPAVKRLAMMTEDHPVAYGDFEGIIPKGEYGGGTVMVWDQGTWSPVEDATAGFAKGSLKFELHGEKLRGRWALVRIRGKQGPRDQQRTWLLIKERDQLARPEADFDVTTAQPDSAASGRTLEQIAAAEDRVWHSNRTETKGNGKAKINVSNVSARVAKKPAATKAVAGKPVAPPPGAPKGKLPAFVSPQLATLVSEAPTGDDWLHEIKFDGFRILARRDGANVTLATRSGQDWTARFAPVEQALAALPGRQLLIDGEVAVLLADGTTSFQGLQNQGKGAADGQSLVYFVFDLLHLDGHDLRPLPLEARKAVLAQLVGLGKHGVIRYADHVVGNGPAFFAQACKTHLEGIVSKRRDRPYITGRAPDWVKTKCIQRQEFVIGGFTLPNGGRKGIGALLVGYNEGGELRYAGKVGTGYTQKSALDLRARLDKLAQKTSPFAPPIKPAVKGAHWVKAALLAEVSFTEMTADGKLRHPSFQGLREDKPAKEVGREMPKSPAEIDDSAEPATKTKPKAKPPTARAAAADTLVSGVKLTHPDRVLYPAVNLTKRDLAAYYEAIADHILPAVRNRPLSLVRCPEGVNGASFYMKHPPKGASAELRTVAIRESNKTADYLVADSLAAIIALVQMSVLEIHTWNSSADGLENPDRVIFDLDPGPRVPWADVVAGARAIRARVEKLGFATFVKTTGGKGLHVVVPLVADSTWDSQFAFAHLIAETLVSEDPARYTTAMPKEGREAKILIDFFRNRRGATAVAAFSTRKHQQASVSLPVEWDEIEDFSPDRPFTVATVPARLAGQKRDPWHDYERSRKSLAHVLAALPQGSAPVEAAAAAPKRAASQRKRG